MLNADEGVAFGATVMASICCGEDPVVKALPPSYVDNSSQVSSAVSMPDQPQSNPLAQHDEEQKEAQPVEGSQHPVPADNAEILKE